MVRISLGRSVKFDLSLRSAACFLHKKNDLIQLQALQRKQKKPRHGNSDGALLFSPELRRSALLDFGANYDLTGFTRVQLSI